MAKNKEIKGVKRVEVRNAMLEVTIVAKFDIGPDDMPDIKEELNSALDTLRGIGEASIVSQRILGEPVDG